MDIFFNSNGKPSIAFWSFFILGGGFFLISLMRLASKISFKKITLELRTNLPDQILNGAFGKALQKCDLIIKIAQIVYPFIFLLILNNVAPLRDFTSDKIVPMAMLVLLFCGLTLAVFLMTLSGLKMYLLLTMTSVQADLKKTNPEMAKMLETVIKSTFQTKG